MLDRIRRFHQLFADNYFYPLVLSSGLALSLYAGRVWLTRQWTFFFLVWNLFLAWTPYFWSLWTVSIHQRFPHRWWLLILPGVLWLLFFPNAPYLITDLAHLYQRPPVPLWYDIGVLISFVWAGCFLAVASLSLMHRIFRAYLGRPLSWLMVLGLMGLSGLGIYVGRFLRWNSWDLFLYPTDVLGDIVQRLAHPLHNLQAYGVTLLFAAFLFVCYGMFVSRNRQPP
jgi:uncharacterized membrane protein